ncbi:MULTISPECIES: hypothetical protein [Bacillus cereus group]|uniref:hypothetical protein n=1 Tax=Bacillus cereus group TaxID=86661 RepID=UPI0005CB7F55|nr:MULTISPECIES: hypothetical protein [Bacillus cereus group]KIZ28951.1 hypothetical protein SK30_18165 [Bacillus cereus]MBJ8126499.1 hypothetical protein [Bacillus cereus]PEV53148.1 hypothetical protein CN422_30505 [Bacillus cereus]PGB50002.1 hypothetical protein COL95_24515 [Bacillus anthracis]
MFKKLVVGALATGIALTGGIGAASASVEDTTNSKSLTMAYSCPDYIGNGKYAQTIYNTGGNYANTYTEMTCHGKIQWYFKWKKEDGGGYYEGRVIK